VIPPYWTDLEVRTDPQRASWKLHKESDASVDVTISLPMKSKRGKSPIELIDRYGTGKNEVGIERVVLTTGIDICASTASEDRSDSGASEGITDNESYVG